MSIDDVTGFDDPRKFVDDSLDFEYGKRLATEIPFRGISGDIYIEIDEPVENISLVFEGLKEESKSRGYILQNDFKKNPLNPSIYSIPYEKIGEEENA